MKSQTSKVVKLYCDPVPYKVIFNKGSF